MAWCVIGGEVYVNNGVLFMDLSYELLLLSKISYQNVILYQSKSNEIIQNYGDVLLNYFQSSNSDVRLRCC